MAEDAAREVDVVSEVFFDKNGYRTKDPAKAVSGSITIRQPDGTLEHHRIVATDKTAR